MEFLEQNQPREYRSKVIGGVTIRFAVQLVPSVCPDDVRRDDCVPVEYVGGKHLGLPELPDQVAVRDTSLPGMTDDDSYGRLAPKYRGSDDLF